MINLSVVIITLNEERNLARCLESVKEIADEVVIVDSLSTDGTRQIAQRFGARFVEQKFLGYQDQKNFAHNLASYDYVLSLDADEVLSPELQNSVLECKHNFNCAGYSFNRLTNYNGEWIRHCGWYPDSKVRLVKKASAKWAGGNIHEHLAVEGPVGHLKGDLLHFSYDSISMHVMQTNKYSSMEAAIHFEKGKRASLIKLVTRPPFQFFKDYFLKKGFLDGRYGFVICAINALYVLLKYAKMKELELKRTL